MNFKMGYWDLLWGFAWFGLGVLLGSQLIGLLEWV